MNYLSPCTPFSLYMYRWNCDPFHYDRCLMTTCLSKWKWCLVLDYIRGCVADCRRSRQRPRSGALLRRRRRPRERQGLRVVRRIVRRSRRRYVASREVVEMMRCVDANDRMARMTLLRLCGHVPAIRVFHWFGVVLIMSDGHAILKQVLYRNQGLLLSMINIISLGISWKYIDIILCDFISVLQ